ncbi:MAG TPA: alkaline phosphatase family protein, partial [Chloroflexota bacterium]
MNGARTLLIGLDGATFSILDPLMERGSMPFLRDFVRAGVRATLRTVMPPLTPPGWTSLMTGQRPGQHGVFDFFQKQAPDSEYFHLTSSEDVGCPTIWSLASDAGRRVIALNFPLMFPPPVINGSIVPGGWLPWRQLRLGCYPPTLFDRLKLLPSFNPRELALDVTLEEKAVEGCATDEYADWVRLHIRRERRWFDVLRHLMREAPADLTGVVFDGVDKLQHLCWRFLDPEYEAAQPTVWQREIAGLCDAYFRQLDGLLADLVELAGPDVTVVVASDHGGGPARDIFCLNTWLEHHGFLKWTSTTAARTAASPPLGIRHITAHVNELDWERTL